MGKGRQDDTRTLTKDVGETKRDVPQNRGIDLPDLHKEGPAYKKTPTLENAARDVYGKLRPGYQREWKVIAGPRPPGEAFQKAYQAYVTDPVTLYQKEPFQHEFLRHHIFPPEFGLAGAASDRASLEKMEFRAERLYQEGLSFAQRALETKGRDSRTSWKDAESKFRSSLEAAREVRNPVREAMSLQRLAAVSEALGKKQEAKNLHVQSGGKFGQVATNLTLRGEFERAKELLTWSGEEYNKVGLEGHVGEATALQGLATIALKQGNIDEFKYLEAQRSRSLLRDGLSIEARDPDVAELDYWVSYKASKTAGHDFGMAFSMERLAKIREATNQRATAGRLYGLSAQRYSDAGDRLRDQGQHDEAKNMYKQSVALLRRREHLFSLAPSASDAMERAVARTAQEIQDELATLDERQELARRVSGDRPAQEADASQGEKSEVDKRKAFVEKRRAERDEAMAEVRRRARDEAKRHPEKYVRRVGWDRPAQDADDAPQDEESELGQPGKAARYVGWDRPAQDADDAPQDEESEPNESQ